MNIVQIILKLLGGGDSINKIAAMLGLNPDQAGKAIASAVPAILASLAGATKKPGGADALANALSGQDKGLLDNLGGFLGSGDSAAKGGSLLSGLLGGDGLGQLGSVISKFTGVGSESSGKLLGLLGPVVLGAIGKSAPSGDAAGISNFLASQSKNIASSVPSGLGDMLSNSIPGIGNLLGGTSDAAGSAASSTIHAARGAVREVEKTSSSAMKWLIPAVLAVLAILVLPKMCSKATDATKAVTESASGAVSAATDGKKFVSEATDMLKSATETIGSIKDETSASSAVPKLRELSAKIGGLESMLAKLPAPVQSTVRTTLRPLIAKLREAAQPVLNLPIVGGQVKPILDEIFTNLDRLVPPN
jgi:Bacterial protein of unknown function (DUF937)